MPGRPPVSFSVVARVNMSIFVLGGAVSCNQTPLLEDHILSADLGMLSNLCTKHMAVGQK